MEGDTERTSINTGQQGQGGNIASEPSDGQETCDKNSTPECAEKPMERALSGRFFNS
jgi:hypothetical protein